MDSIGDIDGTMAFIFHAPQKLEDSSSSQNLDITVRLKILIYYGLYDYERDLTFQEMRILPSTLVEQNGMVVVTLIMKLQLSLQRLKFL